MEFHPLALGAITAALITGFLSLLGLIISKEQKTSEFRQQWIDALRQELAEFLGYAEITATLRSMLELDKFEPGKEKAKIAEGLSKRALRLIPRLGAY